MDVKDIVERETGEWDAKPPEPPKPVSRPFTKKWAPRRRPAILDPEAGASAAAPPAAAAAAGAVASAPSSNAGAFAASGAAGADQPPLTDAERIHLENVRKIQRMSSEEIEREREEIFRSMDPAVLESLLRRAQLKEAETQHAATAGRSEEAQENEAPRPGTLREPGVATLGTRAPVSGTVADWDPSPNLAKEPLAAAPAPPRAPPPRAPAVPASTATSSDADEPEQSGAPHGVHFPPPPEELRQYFPDLPVETEKLAWMQPIGESEEGEYSAELVSVAPSELRFDFKGNLVTPRQSRLISTKEGLHHHGDAPSAAGYTLPELAHLSRSSHPAQRALAIQTSGRVLHKLRLRKFARSSDLQEGLEALVKTTKILDTLAEAADESTRSLTVRTLATEALWLANTDNRKQAQSDDGSSDQGTRT